MLYLSEFGVEFPTPLNRITNRSKIRFKLYIYIPAVQYYRKLNYHYLPAENKIIKRNLRRRFMGHNFYSGNFSPSLIVSEHTEGEETRVQNMSEFLSFSIKRLFESRSQTDLPYYLHCCGRINYKFTGWNVPESRFILA